MHPGGVRSAMDLFDFEKSANLKHPSVQPYSQKYTEVKGRSQISPIHDALGKTKITPLIINECIPKRNPINTSFRIITV